MVNENLIPNKAPIETVYEIENKTPSFEEFMKSYENDGSLNYDDLSGGSVDEVKGHGPCTDGRSASSCYCSRDELLRQRSTVISNINIYNNIQQIINIRFPSTGCIFRLKFIIENQMGYSRDTTYNSVEEAIRSAPRIISGQDFPDEYESFPLLVNIFTLGIPNTIPNWSASSKTRNAAASALQSVIQNYQNGSNVNGWLRVRGRSGDPAISWNY